VTENMQANIFSTKISCMVSKAIEKMMVVSGTIALVWILAFLLVAMIEK